MSAAREDEVAGAEEREVKLDVADGFELPPAAELAPAAIAEDRGERELRSVYWDTEALALAAAHLGIRHRNGVWTFKGPSRREGDSVVREELELEGPAAVIPDELLEHVRGVAPASALHPVAELRNRRHTLILREGEQAVEVVRDSVAVHREAVVVSRFTEVEVEFAPGSAALADTVVRGLLERGAVVGGVGKYTRALRALGHHLPDAGMGAQDDRG